ncbi:ABC transporter permease [Alicyclobacillus fastidiosus]|uniref:ABC transporter permease n=1 Tax=Alicyclobacillus fastidiosus TaxID=392011 RepID=UPI0034D7B03B
MFQLVFLGPIGVVSLTGVHYAVSFEEMFHTGVNNWPYLIQNINFLLIPALILGLTLIASLMTGMEHQGNTWKQLLAMPVPRVKIRKQVHLAHRILTHL